MDYKEYFSSLKGKSVTVVGFGVSNRPFVKMLSEYGAYVTVRDRKEPEKEAFAEFDGVNFVTGEK